MPFDVFMRETGLHPVVARVLYLRGVRLNEMKMDIRHLLSPWGDTETHAGEIKGMQQAAVLFCDTLMTGKPITIVGDYDVDGAASSSILYLGIQQMWEALGGDHPKAPDLLIPDRAKDGYGLTAPLSIRVKDNAALVITVDNGIVAFGGVDALHDRGIPVLVTDHHVPSDHLPDADAIVDPHQPGCGFPSKNICGAGLAWYLLAAARSRLRQNESIYGDAGKRMASALDLSGLLDLVALATVADVVPLDFNNRILVNEGLRIIRSGKSRPGIRALLQVSGVDDERLPLVNSFTFGFQLGPRLNAAGRLGDMMTGIRCLTESDPAKALIYAQELQQINQDRKSIQKDVSDAAEEQVNQARQSVNAEQNHWCVVVGGDWHEGVVGIVAGRIKEHLGRPTFAFGASQEAGILKGSGRSIPGLNIRDMLARVQGMNPGLIIRFGGHAAAAGLSIHKDDLDAFRAAANDATSKMITEEDLQQCIQHDGILSSDDLCIEVAEMLESQSIWGNQFPEPVFCNRFMVRKSSTFGSGHWLLSLSVIEANGVPAGRSVAAKIFLSEAEKSLRPEDRPVPPEAGVVIDAVYRLSINRYRGQKTLEIFFQDSNVLDQRQVEQPFTGVLVKEEVKNCADTSLYDILSQ